MARRGAPRTDRAGAGAEAVGPQAPGIHLRLRPCRAAGNSRGQQVGIDGEINLAAGAEHAAEIANGIAKREAEMLGHGVASDEARFGERGKGIFGAASNVAGEREKISDEWGTAGDSGVTVDARKFAYHAEGDLGRDAGRPAV